ncbi:MAG: hypothetical protein IKA36_06900 [Clostridia bacterium]|nr:hypothetical protein [Clostridia bacterium]
MSKFDLGLEALADQQELEVTGDILSYEYLDTVMQFNDEAAEAVVIADGIGAIASAMENLGAICEVLADHGNSPALEALVGSNFREGFSLEAAGNAKEGLWARFVKWLKTLWAKIKAFFAKFFSSSKAMRTKIRERIQAIKNAGGIEKLVIKVPELSVIEYNNNAMKELFANAIKKVNASLNDPDLKIDTEEFTKKTESGKDPLERMLKVAAGSEVEVSAGKGEKAIALLEKLEQRLVVLEAAKAEIDRVADGIEKNSFAITKEQYSNKQVTKAQAEAAGMTAEQRKTTNDNVKRANAEKKDEASGDFRSRVMKYHSEFSKYLAKATRESIADASYALSAFKPKSK